MHSVTNCCTRTVIYLSLSLSLSSLPSLPLSATTNTLKATAAFVVSNRHSSSFLQNKSSGSNTMPRTRSGRSSNALLSPSMPLGVSPLPSSSSASSSSSTTTGEGVKASTLSYFPTLGRNPNALKNVTNKKKYDFGMFAHHDPNSNTHAGDSVGNNNNSHMKDDKQTIPVVTKKIKTTTKGKKRKTSTTKTATKATTIATKKSTRVKREVVDDEHKTITTPTTKIRVVKDAVAPSTPVSKKKASKTSPSTSISTPKKRTPIKPKSSSTTISTPKEKTTKKKKKTTTKTSSSRKRKRIEQGSLKPPRNWETIYSIVTELRADKTAPLDYDGGAAIPERHRGDVIYRYQVLTALMLSSQTKDKVVGDAIRALQSYRGGVDNDNNIDNDDHNGNHNGNHNGDVIGLDVQSIMNMDVVVLKTLIGKVGFYNNKAKYMKSTAEILLRDYDGDIPSTAEGMIKLSGVGPKMAYIIESIVFNRSSGIGVDTHMHRIFNDINWVKSKTPEQTREQLEGWLPKEKWGELNALFVGFGQESQQQKEKILKKALASSRPVDALGLLKKVGLDIKKEGEKYGLKEEIDELFKGKVKKTTTPTSEESKPTNVTLVKQESTELEG